MCYLLQIIIIFYKEVHLLVSVPVALASENVAAEIWEAIRPEVQATIEEYVDNEEIIDDDDGPVEFQGDVHTALVRYNNVNNSNYYQGFH